MFFLLPPPHTRQLEAERASMQSAAQSARALLERQSAHREAVLAKELETIRKECETSRQELATQTEQGLAWKNQIATLEKDRTTLTEELDRAREEVQYSIIHTYRIL